ncbi:hypothetical protein [Runella aurantiaca]|uniref:Uncharacterized protein n=1 Tax=Runella aurantiaca TaxID=2282308 RepID=A0A369IBH3_9BACT|nr:hypothetical protein [Runella aurantiaca]RDB05797.1 hypothetical protein DVG78_12490 [Runella aurantiaca]
MKNILSIGALSLFFLLTSTALKAQDSNAYFVGKWDIMVKGTPEGDVVLHALIDSKEEKLSGSYVKEVDGKKEEPVMMKSVEIKGQEVILAFTIAGYDVTMNLIKKDEDHADGNMMGMFECKATKVKSK